MRFISPPQQHSSHGVVVEYKTQAPRQDRRHLVVVFSGFCPIGRYNFDGTVADGCRFGLLWINDVFDGDNCYYLTRNMDFSIEHAVIDLIETERRRLGLSKDECTLFGYSKGGSAALFYGLKYGFQNIVASAPQMHIGSFARDNFPSSYRHMIGSARNEDESRDKLDSLIATALEEDAQKNKNIYIISSYADQFHDHEVGAYIEHFGRYTNFNLIMTDSEMVREHKTVGRYNTPILLSILYALGEGSVPSFAVGKTGQREYYSSRRSRTEERVGKWIITCDRLSLDSGRLFIEGAALLAGSPQTKYVDKTVELAIRSNHVSVKAPLGSTVDNTLSDRFYDDGFCDYSAAGYKTLHGLGIDLQELPEGTYSLEISVNTSGQKTEASLPRPKGGAAIDIYGGYYYRVNDSDGASRLIKRSILGIPVSSGVQRTDRLEIVDGGLHVEGIFAIPGVDYSRYDNNLFSLVMSSNDKLYRIPLGQGNRPGLTDMVDAGFGDYSKAYFANRGYKGNDVNFLAPGEYAMHISAFIGPVVFTMPIPGRILEVGEEGRGARIHDTASPPFRN